MGGTSTWLGPFRARPLGSARPLDPRTLASLTLAGRTAGAGLRGSAAFGVLACGAALIAAFGAERWLGLVPCAFCLLERRPYQAGLVLAAVASFVPSRLAAGVLWVVVVVLVGAVLLSGVHVGVEQHWWPDPLPACSVPDFSGMSMAQRIAAMPSRPAKPCEDPDFPIPFLPVSMAQMGFLYAVAVSAILAMSLSRRQGRRFG